MAIFQASEKRGHRLKALPANEECAEIRLRAASLNFFPVGDDGAAVIRRKVRELTFQLPKLGGTTEALCLRP